MTTDDPELTRAVRRAYGQAREDVAEILRELRDDVHLLFAHASVNDNDDLQGVLDAAHERLIIAFTPDARAATHPGRLGP